MFKLTKTGTNYIALVDGSLTADGAIDIDQGILGFTRMVVSGKGSVTARNGATLRFEANTTGSWTGKPVTIDDATLNLFGSNYTLDAVVTLANTATFDIANTRVLTLPQAVTGTGGLTMTTGTGTLILTGANDYSGPTLISAGTLQFGNRTTTGANGTTGTGGIVNNGTLRFMRGDSATFANDISGTGAIITGANVTVAPEEYDVVITLSGNNTFTGNVTVYSGGLKILGAAGLGTGPKNIVVGTTNGTNGRPQVYLDGSGGDITLPSDIAFRTSNNTLTHPAIGNLAGNNTIEGSITLTSGGGSTSVKVLGGSLALNGPVAASNSGRFLTLAGNAGSDGTVNGVISDGTNPLGIVKQEANTWTLANANTYTAATTVNAGTLLVNGNQSTATGAATVNGGTLGGTGTLGGIVTVNSGGTLAPGVTTGTLSTATNVTIDGTLAIDINGTAKDELVVGGILDIGGATLNVTGSGAGLTEPAYIIAQAAAPIVGSFAVKNLPPGYVVVVGYDDGVDTNNIAVVQGVADPYLGWADTNGLVGADRAPTADPDNDGLENGIEFVIGADPNTNTPLANRPGATVIGGNLVFTFKRSDESEDFDVYVEHGTTLAAWPGQILIPAGAYSDANVTVINNDPGLDDVTVTIPMGTDPKKFARLRADIPFTP